jgi:hypothetical protein
VLFIQVLLVINAVVHICIGKYNDIKSKCINFAFIKTKTAYSFATICAARTIPDYLAF